MVPNNLLQRYVMEMFSACTPEKTKSHKAHFSLFYTKEKYYSGKENNAENNNKEKLPNFKSRCLNNMVRHVMWKNFKDL